MGVFPIEQQVEHFAPLSRLFALRLSFKRICLFVNCRRRISSTDNTTGTLMPLILPQMTRTVTGIEVGFFTMVDHAAKHGRAAAFELAAYWSRCRAKQHRVPKAFLRPSEQAH
jgi:hypothetical protein